MYALLFTALLWFSNCLSMEKVSNVPVVYTDMARELADKFLEAADAQAVEEIISAYEPEQWLPAFVIFGKSNPLTDTTFNFYVKLGALIKISGKFLGKLSPDEKLKYLEVVQSYSVAVKAGVEAEYRRMLVEASQGEQERIQQEEQRRVEAMRRERERIQREQERKQEAERRDLAETLKRSLTAQRRSTEVSLNRAEALANVILKDKDLQDVEDSLAEEEISFWVPCFTLYGKMIPEHDLTGLYYEKLEWLIGAIEKKKQEIDQAQYREFKDVSMRMLQGRAEREQEYAEKLKKIKAEKEESRKDAEARLAAEAKRAQEERQKLEVKKVQQKAEEEEARRKKEQERSGTKGQDEALQQKLAERLAKAEAGKMAPLDGQNSPVTAGLNAKQSQEKGEGSRVISKLDEVSRADSNSAIPARSMPPSIASPVVNGRVSPRAEGIGRGTSEQRANESLRELREELDRLKQENGNLPEIKKTFDNELRKARLEVESIQAQLTETHQQLKREQEQINLSIHARMELENSCRVLEEQLRNAESRVAAVMSESNRLKAELSSVIEGLRGEVEGAKVENKKAQIALSVLESQLTMIETQRDEAIARSKAVEQLERQCKDLAAQISLAEQQKKAVEKDLKGQLEKAKGENQQARIDLDLLRSQLALAEKERDRAIAGSKEIESLEKQRGNLASQVASAEANKKAVEKERDEKREELARINLQKEQLEKVIMSERQLAASLKVTIGTLQSEVEKLRDICTGQADTISKLESEVKALDVDLVKVREVAQNVQRELREAQGGIASFEQQLAQKEKARQELEHSCAKLRGSVEIAERLKKEAIEIQHRLEEEKNQLEEELRGSNHRYSTLNAEKQLIEKKLARLEKEKAEYVNADERYARLDSRHKELQARLDQAGEERRVLEVELQGIKRAIRNCF